MTSCERRVPYKTSSARTVRQYLPRALLLRLEDLRHRARSSPAPGRLRTIQPFMRPLSRAQLARRLWLVKEQGRRGCRPGGRDTCTTRPSARDLRTRTSVRTSIVEQVFVFEKCGFREAERREHPHPLWAWQRGVEHCTSPHAKANGGQTGCSGHGATRPPPPAAQQLAAIKKRGARVLALAPRFTRRASARHRVGERRQARLHFCPRRRARSGSSWRTLAAPACPHQPGVRSLPLSS